MLDLKQINVQFVTDETGEKKAVILPIKEFLELLEDIEDLAILAERREETTISHKDLIDELKIDGRI